MKKKKYLAIFMAMSMATATAPVTALADDAANTPATGSTENDAANEATANEWTSFIDGTDLGHTTVPGSDLKYSEVPEIHKAMADGYSAIWASKTDEARAEALATAKANLLTATKNYVQFLLDTAKDITVNDIVYTISEENYNTAKDAIANAETCADVLGAYNTALGTQESYDAQPLADQWTAFIEETDLGHTTVPGSNLKYSEVPEIQKAMAGGYSAIWDAKTNAAGATALETAKANLLTATKTYVQFLLDTAKDIAVGNTAYQIPDAAYNTAKDTIANATAVADVLGAYNTALDAQTTYTYDAQPYADQWTAFIEGTDLGHTIVPGSEMKYSEVPAINKAMTDGYSAIWNTKTNAAGATALETAKANLLTTTKNYVQFLLDTAKDITVGDVTYRIPADVYNTAKDAIANATTVADVLSAYNTALEAQVEVTPVTGVSVTPAQATIRVGNTTTIKAIVTPDDATEKAVTWTSSDDTVATVDSNGVVTGVKVGTATITATTIDGSFAATCEVNVNRKHSSGSSSGGGGGSSVTKYGVTISDSKNGAVTASAAKAETGDKVILTPKADEGYALDKITAKDKDGKEVKLKAEKDGTYSFTMPKGGVTVDTTFKQAEGAANTDKPAAATKTILLQIGSTAVIVDDQAIINDVAPVIRNDRTLVPIRVITEALGGQVAWNEAAKEVTLTVNGKEIKMTIGKALEKYGVAPVIIGGRTFVPVRFVADELGAVTTWDDATKTVTIQAVK
nr:stalk domain-containing protein [uncultured Anaerotignum sp.]